MPKFKVTVTEKLECTIPVEAPTMEEALKQIRKQYIKGEVPLDYRDFSDVDFKAEEMSTVKAHMRDIKTAVKDFQEANKGGLYDPSYGLLMLDTESGNIWTDTFYNTGHSSSIAYDSPHIVNLGRMMNERELEINAESVAQFIKDYFPELDVADKPPKTKDAR